jgi:hypothetical protein
VSDSDLDHAIRKLETLPSVSIDTGKECPIVSEGDSEQGASDVSQVAAATQFNAPCRLLSEVGFPLQMGIEGREEVSPVADDRGLSRDVVPNVVPSAAITAWATVINDDERLQELVMLATSMDVERIDALLAVARGLRNSSQIQT